MSRPADIYADAICPNTKRNAEIANPINIEYTFQNEIDHAPTVDLQAENGLQDLDKYFANDPVYLSFQQEGNRIGILLNDLKTSHDKLSQTMQNMGQQCLVNLDKEVDDTLKRLETHFSERYDEVLGCHSNCLSSFVSHTATLAGYLLDPVLPEVSTMVEQISSGDHASLVLPKRPQESVMYKEELVPSWDIYNEDAKAGDTLRAEIGGFMNMLQDFTTSGIEHAAEISKSQENEFRLNCETIVQNNSLIRSQQGEIYNLANLVSVPFGRGSVPE